MLLSKAFTLMAREQLVLGTSVPKCLTALTQKAQETARASWLTSVAAYSSGPEHTRTGQKNYASCDIYTDTGSVSVELTDPVWGPVASGQGFRVVEAGSFDVRGRPLIGVQDGKRQYARDQLQKLIFKLKAHELAALIRFVTDKLQSFEVGRKEGAKVLRLTRTPQGGAQLQMSEAGKAMEVTLSADDLTMLRVLAEYAIPRIQGFDAY